MKIQIVVHEAEEGGYGAKFPSLHRSITKGDTWEELIDNLKEAVEGDSRT